MFTCSVYFVPWSQRSCFWFLWYNVSQQNWRNSLYKQWNVFSFTITVQWIVAFCVTDEVLGSGIISKGHTHPVSWISWFSRHTWLSWPAWVPLHQSEQKKSQWCYLKSLKSQISRHSPFDLGSLYVLGILWVPAGRSLPEEKQNRNSYVTSWFIRLLNFSRFVFHIF